MAYDQGYHAYQPNGQGYPPASHNGASRGPPPPKQDYGYGGGYQQDYGYENSNGYDANGYDQYSSNPYADDQYGGHDNGGAWGNTYNFDGNGQYGQDYNGYDDYGGRQPDPRSREPQRGGYPPAQMNGRGRGPPPPGPPRGDYGGRGRPPRGPPPRGPDPRRGGRGGYGPPPGHFDPGYTQRGGRRPDPRGPPPPSGYPGGPERPVQGRAENGGRQRSKTMERARDPYAGGEWGGNGGDGSYEDGRNRGPLPQFRSVKGRQPPQDRPGTSNGVMHRQNGLQPPPQYFNEEPQTAPVTPMDQNFPLDSQNDKDGTFSSPTAGPGYFGGGQQFNLPTRSQTLPPEHTNGPSPVGPDEEMPAFRPPPKRSQTTPQPNGSPQNAHVFEMPGDYPPPGTPHAASHDRRPRPTPPPGQQGPPGAPGYPGPQGRDGPGYPLGQPQSGPPSRGMPRQPGGFDPSRPGGSNRPPGNDINARGMPPPNNGQPPRTSPNQNGVNPHQPPNDRRGPPPSSRPPYPHRNSDPETNSAHPTPVRPGLMQNGQNGSYGPSSKPTPVRQYSNTDRPKTAPEAAKKGPVTHEDLKHLRELARANPSNNQVQLDLAKKLAEASTVLASDGGRADPRTAGQNKERFNSEALGIVKRLISNNDSEAMFYLADCMGEEALGQSNDPKEAFVLYQNAAKLGHATAAYRTAVCCEIGAEEGGGTRKDPQKAFQWYKRASSLGDLSATYKMGVILLKGLLGQEKSISEAISYLKLAAERANEENPHALHELGLLYESDANQPVVQKDEMQAFQYFSKAAKLGYKFSQFKLGQGYEYGMLGCKIDARSSIVWYTKAAAQAEHQSELALSGWYLTGAEGILDQSDQEAYLWAKRAAGSEPPLPKAMFAMGYYLEVGIGASRNLEDAKRWYSRAASHNFPKARERLEELRQGGARAAKNREKLSRSNPKKTADECKIM